MATTDFTIADVLEWARTKPADEGYDFCNPNSCALAQFGRATGRSYIIGCGDISPFVGSGEALTAIVLCHTFGGLVRALERVVEPRALKRLWARLTGKTIGSGSVRHAAAPVSTTWTTPDAYMADIEMAVA